MLSTNSEMESMEQIEMMTVNEQTPMVMMVIRFALKRRDSETPFGDPLGFMLDINALMAALASNSILIIIMAPETMYSLNPK